jgi:hypothetical protein
MTLGEISDWMEMSFILLGSDQWRSLSLGQGIFLFFAWLLTLSIIGFIIQRLLDFFEIENEHITGIVAPILGTFLFMLLITSFTAENKNQISETTKEEIESVSCCENESLYGFTDDNSIEEDNKPKTVENDLKNEFTTEIENEKTEISNNPFSDFGDQSTKGGGKRGKFGNDSGTGGEGSGLKVIGDNRAIRKNLSVDHIVTDTDVTIYLKLTINENGDVVSAKSITSKTTTTNEVLINKVISEVIKQVKYIEDPGTSLALAYYTVKIEVH